MATRTEYFDINQAPANVPLWREAYTGIDWVSLRCSPVYYGIGVPRGDGAAVILVPGFMATDSYLHEFSFWLKRVGYRPYMSQIGRNAECLDVLHSRLEQTIDKAYRETGRKVHLIGHSLGGLLSLAAAVRWPDKIASVVTMGSPFRGIRSHPLVLRTSERVRERLKFVNQPKSKCFTSECNCNATQAMQNRPGRKVAVTAIYTKSDGVVDWRYCMTDNPSDNFEVKGTHIGLAFNPAVYRLVAFHLAGKGRAVAA